MEIGRVVSEMQNIGLPYYAFVCVQNV